MSRDSSDNLSDEMWDTAREEARRKIDYQIQANRDIKNRAAGILKLVFTLAAVILSITSLTTSLILADAFPLSIDFFNPEVAIEQTANSVPYTNRYQSGFLMIVITFSILAYLYLGVSSLSKMLSLGIKVQKITTFNSGFSPEESVNELPPVTGRREYRNVILEKYQDQVRQNRDILRETEELGVKFYNQVEHSIRYLVPATILLTILFSRIGVYVFLGTLITVAEIVGFLRKRVTEKQWIAVAQIHADVDTLTLLLALSFINVLMPGYLYRAIELSPLLSSLIMVVLFVGVTVSIFGKDAEPLGWVAVRNTCTCVATLPLVFFITIQDLPFDSVSRHILDVYLSFLFALLYSALLGGMIYSGNSAIQWIRSKVQLHKLFDI